MPSEEKVQEGYDQADAPRPEDNKGAGVVPAKRGPIPVSVDSMVVDEKARAAARDVDGSVVEESDSGNTDEV